MAGETKIPKLQVLDLGTEGTGDRIALFDSDGKLVGYVLKTAIEGFVPLSGTEAGKPITGDLEIEGYGRKIYSLDSGYENSIEFFGDEGVTLNYDKNNDGGKKSRLDLGGDRLYLESDDLDFKGLLGNLLYNKQNDPNAFAQLGDIATRNNTATTLSLATLNADYAVQGVGFKVICPTINVIYIKSSLTTWEQFSTTTVV